MKSNKNKGKWKAVLQEMMSNVQGEIKKTTDIGIKMFSASKTNSCLKDSYEELGRLVAKELNEDRLDWKHTKLEVLLKTITDCEESLVEIEKNMNKVRFSSGPEDVSQEDDEQ